MSPLEGLRVLDLSRLLPGYCSLVLADLGADVVKVEDPQGGDYLRHLPPMAGESAARFHALNRGKRSAAIDLKAADGAAAFRRLAARADVLIESFRPGVMERLGLGCDALREQNPRLVYCSLNGWGTSGPMRNRAGHDLNYVARSGILGYGGEADGPPAMSGVQIADMGGVMMAVVGVLAALQERSRTGQGRRVDVSLYESAFAFLHMHLGARLAMAGQGGPLTRGVEELNGGFACYGVYRTKDGRYLSVAALEPKFWNAFCSAVGRDDLADSGWTTGEAGRRTREEVAKVIGGRSLAEWESFLADKDLCCEPVREGDEVLADAAFPRDFLFDVADPHEGRDIRHLRTPLRMGEPATRPAPALGEHTAALLVEAGLTADEVADLSRRGVIR